jgi:hypothetical protein
VLLPLFDDALARARAARADLAAAVVLEAEEEARGRGAPVLARIEAVIEWRGEGGGGALAGLRGPRDGAEVVWARPTETAERALAETAWRAQPRVACAPALGESDALGAAAVAIAASRVGQGVAPEALVVGAAQGGGYAILLGASSSVACDAPASSPSVSSPGAP